MAELSLPTATRVWASALGDLYPVPAEKLSVLERVCNAGAIADAPNASAVSILQRSLPIIMFLKNSSGKCADKLLAPLVESLRLLPQRWLQQQAGPVQVQGEFTELMAAARWLLQSPDVPASLKQQLSPALAQLLRAMLTDTVAVEDPMSPGWLKTSCHLLLRALTRTPEFAGNSSLPLMPADAEQLLQWAAQRFTPSGGSAAAAAAGSAGADSSQELGVGALPPMLLQDDKIYLVLSKLVATAYGERGSSQALSHSSSYSVRKGLLQHSPQLMGQLLSWSSSLVKRSLDDFMHSADDSSGGAMSREAAYAASHLASTCVHQLLASQELGTTSTAGLKQHLHDVIDVALSVAEASVAMGSSSTLRLQPDADKALMLSARVLEGATPFVAALSRSSSPPEQLQLASRIKAVVQTTARLTLLASKTAAAEEAPGPVAALGQKLVAGLGRLRPRRAMLVQRSEARMELAQASSILRLQSVQSFGLTPSGAQEDAQDIMRQLEPLLQNPWNWDVAQPLTRITHGIHVRQVPLEAAGWGPQLLARSAAEMWAEALAASWQQGQPTSVRALVLLPVTGSVQEAMVVALTAGRLYTKLGADAALGQLVLPLLAVYLTNSPFCSAEMAGVLVCSLEGMAAAAVKHSDGAWVYTQAVQLLLKLYREPTSVSRQLLAGREAHPAVSGLLADALESLAEALSNAPNKHRLQLRSKLLLLFTDVGLRLGSSATAPSGLEATDLGELLPAMAKAAEGLQPRTLSLLGASSSRMSMQEIQSAQREDASATRLFRTLWLYASLHKLVDPTTPLSSTFAMGAAGDTGPGEVNPEWQQAAGRLAAVTPLLVVGTDNYIEDDMVERLQVELGQQLVRAGKLGNTGPMMAALQQLVQPQGNPPAPTKDVLVAFILAVAMAELSRATLAPLPDPDEDGVLACPVPITLGYLQGVLPEGVASAWLVAIVRRSFQLYLRRLTALQKAQLAGGAVEPSATRAALAYAEQLAQALIQHLGDAGGAVDGSTPAVAALSNTLLELLLEAFPALYFSRPCYRALFAQLQREEGDLPMGQVQASGARIVWERTQAWVTAAAQHAPATTEALLHSFICSTAVVGTQTDTFLHTLSRSMSVGTAGGFSRAESPLPNGNLSALANGHVAASYQLQQRQQHAAAGAPTDSLLFPSSSSREGFHASQAAFRRAADLLQICGAARTKQQAAGADGAYEGTLAFARKLHYSGAVAGLMQGSAEEEDVMGTMESDTTAGTARRQQVAEQIVAHLEDLLQDPRAPQAALDDAHLSASALLAVEQHRFASTELGQRLLKDLCSAPLQRLTPATVKLAMFSWAWVTAESPEVLVQLVSSIASAWVWTVDQRRGLFSGQPHPTSAAADALSSSSGGAGAGGSALRQQQGGVGDDATLQAIAAHHVWLSYLLELWSVVSLLGDEREAAVQHKFARLLYVSLANPGCLTHHPAAVGAYFRLLQLGLAFGRSQLRSGYTLSSHPVPVLLLFDQILRAGLLWFKSPPRYYARWTRSAAAEQVASLEQFLRQLKQVLTVTQGTWPSAFAGGDAGGPGPSSPHPVWGFVTPDVAGYVQLLQFLCGEELKRLVTWVDPVGTTSHPAPVPSSTPWERFVKLAWKVDAGLAVGLLAHFPMAAAARRALEALVVEHASDTRVQKVPAAAALLVSAAQRHQGLSLRPLATWQPGAAELGLQLLSGEAGDQQDVRTYAIKCLFNEPPERVVFFLPQLVQLLRGDDGAISSFFLTTARHSDLFAHNLMWALASESRPPEEAFNPEVKRSGWQPPKDTGLWTVAAELRSQIEAGMTPPQRDYWEAEDSYFTQVTNLSGYLYKFSKDERRSKLQEALATFRPPRGDLYLPTNADCRVVSHIPSSGACMQSAAKVPILVAFNVIPHTHPADTSRPVPGAAGDHSPTANGRGGSSSAAAGAAPVPVAPTQKMACIFKVGDDIRQDVLAIQVITLLRDAFERAGLGLYLRPYGCLPTGYECGIIEVVPNCKSRAALGELSDRGLYDIFTAEFGAPGSAAFERARFNFIVSEAAYAVASYLLQAKDRHNGNIMLDDKGHIVHIDFGFILEISPGGNLGFESAAFKLSHEMAQVLDPGGLRASPQFRLFEELVVRAYLAARTVAEPIIATVALMAGSGLPCFGRGAPVANLRQRFRLDLNDAQAAAFMRQTIADAYDKWTTGFYDYIQSLQNKIPY